MNGKAIGRGVAALGGLACVAVLAWPRLFPPPPPKERELPRSESMMPTSKAAPTPVGSPELRANPEKVEFGDLRLQGVAVRRLVQIVNKGTAAVAVDPPAGLGDEVAIVRQNCGGRTLGPEDSCQLMVEAQPKEVGPFSAQIAFVTRGSVLLTITATGSAVAPPPASSATATAQPVAAAPVTTTSAPAPAKPDPQVLDALARRQERPPRLIRSDRPAARAMVLHARDDDYTRLGIQREQSGLPVDRTRVLTADRYITLVLETPIAATLPGEVRAMVDQPVYSAAGRNVLIPTGTRFLGRYAPSQQVGMRRVGITWTRMIWPDGRSAVFSWAGSDAMGRAGVPGEMDQHLLERYGAWALETTFEFALAEAMGSQAQATSTPSLLGTQTTTPNAALLQAFQQAAAGLKTTTEGAMAEAFPTKPTVTVAAGTEMVVIPATDMWVRAPTETEDGAVAPVDALAQKRVVAALKAQDEDEKEAREAARTRRVAAAQRATTARPANSAAAEPGGVEYRGPAPPPGSPTSATLEAVPAAPTEPALPAYVPPPVLVDEPVGR